MKSKVACCYFTHNHDEIIRSVIEHCYKVYAKHEIDICVYDDSDDEKTEKVIEEYRENGASNVYYVDAHLAEGANNKMFLLMNGYGLPGIYDYIWPVKDRLCFEDSYLDRLCEKIDEGHDVVLGMNEWQRWDISLPVKRDYYFDPVLFYRDYGFFITNWECTIRKIGTMLSPVDWTNYSEAYDIQFNPFNQLISLFARAAEMDDFSAAICRYDQNERFFAPGGHSGWENEAFNLWIDKWVSANYMLPNVYDPYKTKVIKDETNLRDIFGSVANMINYREKNIYNRDIFIKYRNMWAMLTDVPLRDLELIADGSFEEVFVNTLGEMEKAMEDEDFAKARYLFVGNAWFKDLFDEDTYNDLFRRFNEYTYDILSKGESKAFCA